MIHNKRLIYKGSVYREAYPTVPAMPGKFVRDSLAALERIEQGDVAQLVERATNRDTGSITNGHVIMALGDLIGQAGTKRFLKQLQDNYDYLEKWAKSNGDLLKATSWLGDTAAHLLETWDYWFKRIPTATKELQEYYADYFTGSLDFANPTRGARDLDELNRYYEWDDVVAPMLQGIATLLADAKQVKRFAEFLVAEKHNMDRRYEHQFRRQVESGDPLPYGAAEVETMWHATPVYQTILQNGFKTRDELGAAAAGIGGDVKGISFTADYSIAQGIADGLKDMVTLLSGDRTGATIKQYGHDLGFSDQQLTKILTSHGVNRVPDDKEIIDTDEMYSTVSALLSYAQAEGWRYDPVFFMAKPEAMARLDPAGVGIIEAKVNTTKAHEYLRSMEEWRVPKEAIMSYGPVGSQDSEAP